MNSIGLDFLGRHGWRSAITSRQATPSRENVQVHIPTALLPIKKQENLLAGRDAENHRRGRVLPWPLEAQVPVLGRPENGSGRVPFAALFEQIAKAETTWGRLGECRFAWRPEGTHKIEVDASKLIAHHVNQAAQECPIVGLVVPDSLGIAGQQALISACFGKQAILVPKTVAVALAWCNRAKQDGLISARRELFIGHLTVVDMAFGSWSVSKIPLFAAKHNGLFWIQPVHFPNLKRTKLTTTGVSILSTALNGSDLAMLKLGWARDILSGAASLPGIRSSANTRQRSSIASLQSLVGNGDLNLAFREVFQAMQDIALGPEYGQCLRLLLTGPLAAIRVEREPMSALFKSRVNGQTEESPETDAVDGAAWAAHGMATGTPTWLEMIEPLDIYYIDKNELGDADHAWLPVLETKLIQAGVEYRNPEPIGGLKLQSGHSYIQITLRRPNGTGAYEFRKIETTEGTKCDRDIPLVVNVAAKPGQGFAEVRVESKERDLFASHLDWQRMGKCDEPPKPKLAYIPQAVELIPAPELWHTCHETLQELLELLSNGASSHQIEVVARLAVSRLNKNLLAERYATIYARTVALSEYHVYTPMGRHAHPPDAGGAKLLDALEREMIRWISRNRYDSRAHKWLKKIGGWWYVRCPASFLQDAEVNISRPDIRPSAEDLHIAGLCIHRNINVHRFYQAYCRKLPEGTAPNNWLKALRNIVKFNEHALRDVSADIALQLFVATKGKFEWAYSNNRPQITQNSLEALIFLLKRRRYESGFLAPGTQIYKESLYHAQHCHISYKALQLGSKFQKFLTSEAEMSDVGTLLVDDDDEED